MIGLQFDSTRSTAGEFESGYGHGRMDLFAKRAGKQICEASEHASLGVWWTFV